MAVETGYSKIVTSGSVFLYDTGDTVNSWKGAPTTNLATFDVASAVFSTDTPGNLTQTANSTEATYQGRLSKKMTVGAGYWNAYIYNYNTGVSSTVFAVSYKVKLPGGAHPSSIIGGGYIYGSAGSFFPAPTFTSLGDGWYLATMLYSGTSMTLNSLTGMNGTGPGVFYITDYQAEAKSFSTPFAGVAGTRSTTQGMIDIVGGNTIDLVNMSYGANNAISFDGTDDYTGVGNLGNINDFTVEIVFKSDSVSNYRNPMDCNWLVYSPSYSNIGPRLEQNSSGNLGWVVGDSVGNYTGVNVVSSGLNGALYHYASITRVGSYFVAYYNGAQSGTAVFNNWYGAFSNLNIGRGFSTSSERWFIGKIPIVKIYNRALSASEVLTNFNHYKTRFNIT